MTVVDLPSEELSSDYSDPLSPEDLLIPENVSDVDSYQWDHMPLTYTFVDRACKLYQSKVVLQAMKEIETQTNGVVYFKEVHNALDMSIVPDITIRCTLIENCYKEVIDVDGDYITKTETICAHEKGTALINETDGLIIKHAELEFFGFAGFGESGRQKPSGFAIGDCGHASTEIHELLHAFGYDHSDDFGSIMYPEETVNVGYSIRNRDDCIASNKDIDEWIVDDLIFTYQK